MQPHEILTNQLEKWVELTADLTDKLNEKPEDEITKRDIIKIAQKVEDVINVLYSKSKISGWRL